MGMPYQQPYAEAPRLQSSPSHHQPQQMGMPYQQPYAEAPRLQPSPLYQQQQTYSPSKQAVPQMSSQPSQRYDTTVQEEHYTSSITYQPTQQYPAQAQYARQSPLRSGSPYPEQAYSDSLSQRRPSSPPRLVEEEVRLQRRSQSPQGRQGSPMAPTYQPQPQPQLPAHHHHQQQYQPQQQQYPQYQQHPQYQQQPAPPSQYYSPSAAPHQPRSGNDMYVDRRTGSPASRHQLEQSGYQGGSVELQPLPAFYEEEVHTEVVRRASPSQHEAYQHQQSQPQQLPMLQAERPSSPLIAEARRRIEEVRKEAEFELQRAQAEINELRNTIGSRRVSSPQSQSGQHAIRRRELRWPVSVGLF
eukprot:NODE_2021_length_1321_cov_44.085692_g1837_i0.p1 GENE.NODE_2021_length_1321_cov_44.085692_g1837_i0~~NODE_2021_length_1321_cov_44.085692_g1837_i0.p1  ORF type:complete len:357 (-),score=75.47 NODE_2021_length_1321_cov_44.085692_g1837_i0:250-1320(-)